MGHLLAAPEHKTPVSTQMPFPWKYATMCQPMVWMYLSMECLRHSLSFCFLGAVQTGLVSLEANPSTCQRTDIYVKYQSLLQSQRNALSDGDSNQIGKNAAQQTLAEVQADLDDARTGSKALAVHVSKLSSENEALRSGNAVITQQLEEARWYAGEVQRLQVQQLSFLRIGIYRTSDECVYLST
jgi:hypothetical protein